MPLNNFLRANPSAGFQYLHVITKMSTKSTTKKYFFESQVEKEDFIDFQAISPLPQGWQIIIMENQQNLLENCLLLSCNSFKFSEDERLFQPTPQKQLIRDPILDNFTSPQPTHLYTQQLQHLGANSLYTISRASLQMIPSTYQMELQSGSKEDSHLAKPKWDELGKFSADADKAEIRSKEGTITFRQFSSFGSVGSLQPGALFKNYSQDEGEKGKNKFLRVRHYKQLFRQLCFEGLWKDFVIGDVYLRVGEQIKRIRRCKIMPVLGESENLNGVLLVGRRGELKVRVVEKGVSCSRFQLWGQKEQEWLECVFHLRLLS